MELVTLYGNPVDFGVPLHPWHRQWVNETNGFVSLCLWQISMPMCIGQKWKNGSRQTDGWTEFFQFFRRIFKKKTKMGSTFTTFQHIILLVTKVS